MSLGQQINIQIPKPCKQDFDAMPRTTIGRQCHVCEREVIDFTMMNEDELRDYLKNNPFNLSCGIFRNDQLNRPIHIEKPTPFFRFHAMRKWVAALFLFQLNIPQIFAQHKEKTTQTSQQKLPLKETKIIIQGKVILDATQQGLDSIEVSLIDAQQKLIEVVHTNREGKFAFMLPANYMHDTVQLAAHSLKPLLAESYFLDISHYISYNPPVIIRMIPDVEIQAIEATHNNLIYQEVHHTAGVPLPSYSEISQPIKFSGKFKSFRVFKRKKSKH